MALFDNLLTVFILLSLVIIIYLKMAKKTITELISDLREAFSSQEEVIQ
tara:strand:- start:1446 stop:1592 length:147 start_codon:yes stop_codon:yes gene_type:complete